MVEAKRDVFERAWGQCLAEMLAAQGAALRPYAALARTLGLAPGDRVAGVLPLAQVLVASSA